MKEVKGFEEWYAVRQKELKQNSLAVYFKDVRTLSQHVGINPVIGGSITPDENGKLIVKHHFEPEGLEGDGRHPNQDVFSACRSYFILMLQLIWDCYDQFGDVIDPQKYYTVRNLRKVKLSIEDVEEELGFPRGWTNLKKMDDEGRLKLLRQYAGLSELTPIFKKYRIKTLPKA
jgi:hypothetical protein